MFGKERDYKFDNIKALLIILVVLGHIIEYLNLDGIISRINITIFVFHMPFFVFVSGYFCKNLENIESKNIKNALIPFFILNTSYVLLFLIKGNRNLVKNPINVFEPVYAFWYLFSLFTWKVLIRYIPKFKYSIILLTLISLYVGTIDSIGRVFSLSRTIVYFPFFMLGYYTTNNQIEKIRKINKKITIPLLIIFLLLAYFLTNSLFTLDLLKNAQSYAISGVGKKIGIIVRFLQIVMAIVISICIINLISNKNNWMADIGKKTISIYAFSPFIQQFLTDIINENNPSILQNKFIAISICVISTILIIVILSRNIVYNTYNNIIKWIYKKIIKNKNLIDIDLNYNSSQYKDI